MSKYIINLIKIVKFSFVSANIVRF